MKSERRHELEHNVLATWLDQTITSTKPHVNKILGGILAVILLFCALLVWTHFSATSTEKAWAKLYDSLGDSDKMSELASLSKNSVVSQLAACAAADASLDTGCNLLFEDTGKAKTEIRKAIDNYNFVLDNSSDPALRERATFGLARAKEASGEDGALELARSLYLKVAKQWPNGAYAQIAADRAHDLEKKSTLAFYDRFAQFKPKARTLSEPGDKPLFDIKNNMEPPPSQIKNELKTTFDLKVDDKKSGDKKDDDKKNTEEKPDASEGEKKADASAKPETPAAPEKPAMESNE